MLNAMTPLTSEAKPIPPTLATPGAPRRALRRWSPTLLALATLLVGSGCTSLNALDNARPGATPAQAAASAVPAQFSGAVAAADGATLATPAAEQPGWAWQQVLLAPPLQRLTTLALAHNLDLRQAVLAIDAARAQYRITEADAWPTVKASLGSSASRSAADLNGGTAKLSRSVSAGLGISAWELDLWGRLGQLKDSAQASYLATEASRDSVRASLVAELAQAWLTLQADQRLLVLAQGSADSQASTLALTRQRHALGAATALDLASAQASADSALLSLASARTQLSQDLNALRLLLGTEPPAELLPTAPTLAQALDAPTPVAALAEVPANLPSSVLQRRPDVRAAEQKLLAARANLSAARAALYPTLSLTTSVGTASNALNGLFGAGNSTWTFAPTLSLPIFDGGSSAAGLDAAKVAEQQQIANYQQVLQTAFKEVADALAVRAHLAERLAAQQRLAQAQAETLRLTRLRHAAGAESALSVHTAERALWSAQQALVSLQLSEQANRLTLFKALGGA